MPGRKKTNNKERMSSSPSSPYLRSGRLERIPSKQYVKSSLSFANRFAKNMPNAFSFFLSVAELKATSRRNFFGQNV